MKTEQTKQHQWLQQLVGEWTYEGETNMGADNPPEKFKGTENVRSIGGLWTVGEGHGAMPDGSPATMIMTLGYDPRTERFVGTWIGSMMSHLWHYDGELDAAEKVLTLNSEGPAMGGDRIAKYKDVIEIVSPDHRILSSHTQGEQGSWTCFMTAHYHRRT